MPTFAKRKEDGQYYVQWFDRKRLPPRKRVYLGTSVKREAERKMRELEARHAAGAWCPWRGEIEPSQPSGIPDNPVTIREALDTYLAWKDGRVRQASSDTDLYVLEQFAVYTGAERELYRINVEDVDRWLRKPKRDNKQRADATIAGYRDRLGIFLRWCVERKMLWEDVTREAKVRKPPKAFPRYLMPEQVDALLVAIGRGKPIHQWLAPVVRFDVYTGLRATEVGQLRWGDVMMRGAGNALVHVRHHEQATKSGKERHVPLSRDAIAVLDAQARLIGQTPDPASRVFVDDRGALTKDHLSKTFLRYRREAGLPEDISFHSLRHTACSWLAMLGASAITIREFAGHSHITISERYMHLAPRVGLAQVTSAFDRVDTLRPAVGGDGGQTSCTPLLASQALARMGGSDAALAGALAS